jgi:hypothetical protein
VFVYIYMIPFLALYYSTLNIELKNEILYHIIMLTFNQVCITQYINQEYISEIINYDDIACDWELITVN